MQVDPIHVYFAPTERDRLDVLRGAREGRIPAEREGNIRIELRLGDGTPYPHPGVDRLRRPDHRRRRAAPSTVRALVPNPEGVLKPGEFVRAIAVFPDVRDAVLVPRARGARRAGRQLRAGRRRRGRQVEYRARARSAPAHDGMQQITEGLAAGERVIVDGVQKARPGDRVEARELEAAAPAAAKP